MRKRGIFAAIVAAIALGALLVPTAATASEPWPTTKPYSLAASAGFDVTVEMISANNAFGPINCETGLGGACFDATGHEGLFTVDATDMAGGSVGIFMGFDVDGDGCVGCSNGDGPPGSAENPDMFWQGADVVDGFIVDSADPVLYVFIRLVTVQTGDLGTMGEITINKGCSARCNPTPDFNMGTVCARGVDPGLPIGAGPEGDGQPGRGCEGTEIRGMYPYPRIPPVED